MNEALKASGILNDSAKVTLAVTAASYATAFAFERGSAAFLGVPQDLVAVDLRSLLPCAAAAVMVVILLLPILELLAAWWPRWWPAPLQRRARNAVAPVFLWSSLALVLWDGTLWTIVAGTCVLSAISVLHHWMRYREEGPAYIAALEALRCPAIQVEISDRLCAESLGPQTRFVFIGLHDTDRGRVRDRLLGRAAPAILLGE